MQTITLKLFSAIRHGIIKSRKMFWDLYADFEKLDLDTAEDKNYLERHKIKINIPT